jgi:hypothetical protein
MSWVRSALSMALALAVGGTALPALAGEIEGVLEKVDESASRIVVRETHGRKHVMPLNVVAETQITTPSGAVSIGALHVGDRVTVHHAPGPEGETASRIRVTEPAGAR